MTTALGIIGLKIVTVTVTALGVRWWIRTKRNNRYL